MKIYFAGNTGSEENNINSLKFIKNILISFYFIIAGRSDTKSAFELSCKEKK